MMQSPPSRYRIVERGRRLVTIDTATGQEIGMGAWLPNVNLEGAKQTVAPMRDRNTADKGDAPLQLIKAQIASASAPSALSPLSTSPAGSASERVKADFSPDNQGKGIGLIVGAVMLLIFLIATNLWPVPLFLMLVPQTRQWILPKLKAGLLRYFGQDANG
jgi:hypothetical protein